MNFRKTKFESWLEWKKTCSLALCKSDAQSDIQDWAVPILLRAEKANGAPGDELEERAKRRSNGVSDTWRDLELYCENISKKYKNPWKDVICDNADDCPGDDSKRDSFEGQICMRVRALATDEKRAILEEKKMFPHRAEEPVSRKLDAPTFGESFGSASELTPDAVAVWKDLCALAEKEVNTVLSQFSWRERFALGCKSKEIPLYLPEVVKAAKIGKTQLSEAFIEAETKFQSMFAELHAKYANESDPEDLEPFLEEFRQAFLDCCQEVVPPEIMRLGRS